MLILAVNDVIIIMSIINHMMTERAAAHHLQYSYSSITAMYHLVYQVVIMMTISLLRVLNIMQLEMDTTLIAGHIQQIWPPKTPPSVTRKLASIKRIFTWLARDFRRWSRSEPPQNESDVSYQGGNFENFEALKIRRSEVFRKMRRKTGILILPRRNISMIDRCWRISFRNYRMEMKG